MAIGLTLIFGVMDIVNFAHGEFLMLGMYASFWMFALLALDPMFTLPLTVLVLFAFGVLLYRLVVRRIIDAPPLSQIFTTFGLMLLMRGLAQFFWKPDYRTIENSLVAGSIKVAGVQVGRPQVVAGLGAVLVTGLIYFFLNRTKLGAALEATAADKEAARLMGIDSHKMFALAWGTAAACAGAAGGLLSTFFPIFPDVGANFILLAFVVVNLGGFGSVMGAFWAGIIVGVTEMNEILGHPRRVPVFALLALAVALLVPFLTDDPSHLNMAILALMAAQVGVAWNLLGGYAGQVSLGHVAFYGLGAYTSTLLLVKFGINPWLGMLAGGVAAAVLSAGVGWSCFRLKGHYFTMPTIAAAEIVQIVFTNWEYAGTAVGLTIPMEPQGLGGVGTLFGPVIGSVVLTAIEELSRASFGGTGRGTDTVIYAGLIVVIAVFYPSGIIGWYQDHMQRWKARAAQAKAPATHTSASSSGATPCACLKSNPSASALAA